MSEDPLRYLIRTVFDEADGISASDEKDMKLVPKLIQRYMKKLASDSTRWKNIVQAHALEIVADLAEQIDKNVVAETHITYQPTGETLAWRSWTKSVPKDYVTPHFKDAPDDNCKKCLLKGYEKTIYPEAEFDSKQEKWLADILEREKKIKRWARVPLGQLPIFYAAGDYNPDFIADDGKTLYLLEVKSAAELAEETVQRKAKAAKAWCKAAAPVDKHKWVYKLIPHDSIHQTDSFDGVVSKEYKLEE